MARKASYLVALAAVGGIATGGVTSAADEPSGSPLTKEQYFQKTIELEGDYSKSNPLYYDISLKPLPPKRCARFVRRYADRLQALVEKGGAVVPPAEISETHHRLVEEGGGVVRKIRKVSKPVARGKLRCGAGNPPGRKTPPSEAGAFWKLDPTKRIHDIYARSELEALFEDLRTKGYAPSGA
jgi:hypothetical protein